MSGENTVTENPTFQKLALSRVHEDFWKRRFTVLVWMRDLDSRLRQNAVSSWKFVKIKDEQTKLKSLKTILINDNNVRLSIFFVEVKNS